MLKRNKEFCPLETSSNGLVATSGHPGRNYDIKMKQRDLVDCKLVTLQIIASLKFTSLLSYEICPAK